MANYLLISGCSDIGFVTAKKLIELDHKVFITGRNEEKTSKIANSLGIEYKILEASDFDEVSNVFALVKNRFGKIDGVANFSGSLF
jgi:short-subunit dehydrogenase involved in D-alanine esterification of teichoic acids